MAFFQKAMKGLGFLSSGPPPSSRSGNKRKKPDGSNTPLISRYSAGSFAARRAGKRDDGVHRIMISALWAVARTPALVEAVERVEATYNEEASQLSVVLSKLGRRTDNDAAKDADAFLRTSRLTFYDHMEPMEAIRAIIGLSADSEQVLEEAATTTYRTTMKCNIEGCRFSKDDGPVTEEQLDCKTPKVELSIELRAACAKRDHLCPLCNKKGVAKRYIIDKPARCLVATWPGLVKAESAQEYLCCSTYAEQFRFKLGVMIVNRDNKFVCMFRDGRDYFRVEGDSVKVIAQKDWVSAQPCLALFNFQGAPGDNSPRSRSPRGGTGLPSFTFNGGGQAGRKRQRQQMGHGQLSGGSGNSSSARGAFAAAAEVIEVDDDDSDRGGGDTSQPGAGSGGGGGGDADDGDPPTSNSSGGGTGVSGEVGAAANWSSGKGKRESRHGEREAKARPQPRRQAIDVDDSNACKGVILADKPPESAAADDGGRSGARAGVARSAPLPAAPATASPAMRKHTARDGGSWGVSSSGMTATSFLRQNQEAPWERDRKDNPVWPPRIPSFSDEWPRDSWMGQDGSPSEAGASAGAADSARSGSGSGSRSRSPSLASATTASSARQRSRYFDNPDGAAPAGGRAHADSTAKAQADSRMDVDDGDDDEDDDDDDVQLVESKQRNLGREGEEEGRRRGFAVSSPDSSAADAGAGASSIGSSCTVSIGPPAKRASDSPRQHDPERGARSNVSGGSLDPSHDCEVHDVDDDAPPTSPTPAAMSNGKKHPSGVAMPFVGPARPPPKNSGGGFIGPAPPSQSQPGGRWFKRNKDEEARRKAVAAARANRGPRKAGGGGSSSGAGGQSTIPSSWEKTGASTNGSGGRNGSSNGSNGSSFGKQAQWRPPGNGAAFMGAGGGGGGGGGGGYRLGDGGSGSGGGGSSSNRLGRLRSRGENVTEDLTGAEDSWQKLEDFEDAGVGRKWSSGDAGRPGGGDATLTTIRGINLQHDHFDRILDSDGWLTSQIIDVRVKQLQDLYPQNLYFDTSFFGFLCPGTDRGGAFLVDYGRVKGWTKASRLPAGKSSLFDMHKLFIPINQGNVHWVLVVVDMNGSGSGSGAKMVFFFDSFGRDGTTYVEAVQQYLVSELSHRDKARQEHFASRTRPPANAPRQHNSSDCGVLMLHVMEELSTRPANGLTRLTQDEIVSLRNQLLAKIRE
eukprot:g12740.t1